MEPVFKVGHFGIEHFVVVVGLKLLDLFGEFFVFLYELRYTFFEIIGQGPEVIKLEVEIENPCEALYSGFNTAGIVAVQIGGDFGYEVCQVHIVFTCFDSEKGDNAGRAFVIGKLEAEVFERFFEFFVGDRAEYSWFTSVRGEACDAADEYELADVEFTADIEDAFGIYVPGEVGFFADKENKVVKGVGVENI